MTDLHKFKGRSEEAYSDLPVRIGIPKIGEPGMVHLVVTTSKLLPEEDVGIRYANRMVLCPAAFNKLNRAQMESDFATMRQIFEACFDMLSDKEQALQKEKKLLGL
jgi:hypothetical protein